MEKTNGGGDYFENDNNGLWSWYITNIRNGDFEELTGNQLKRSLLKRFLHIYLDPEFSSRPDTKVMIVSIPENIHRDLALLESFLHEHFHLDDMQITKLTTSHVYNHENHYIVTDKVNNFKDPGFLQFAKIKNIQLAGTAGALGDDMMKYREQNGNGIPSPPPSSVQMVKNNTEDSSEDAEGDDDSIVIDFVHHGHHPVPNPTIQQTETVSTNDDAASIDSCDSVVAAGTDASYEGPPLSLTTTRTGESCFSSEEDDSELASVDSTSQTCDDDWSSSQIDTFMSILPSISIEDSFGHFRLVLQSVLFQNPVNKEIFTAIRQSNNEPTIADVNDDWLLYDSDFSMDNLQMLTLQDLTETNTHCPKILFYSLVEVLERVIRDSETEHACSLETHTESVTRAPSVVSVSCEPELFYPVPPGAHGNNKLTKGCTNDSNGGQKSVNSDWHRRSLAFSDVHSHAPRVLTAADPSNGQTDSTTLGVVERSRSTPLPAILKTISGVDQRNKSWKGKLRRRTSRKGHRPSGDKSCIIS